MQLPDGITRLPLRTLAGLLYFIGNVTLMIFNAPDPAGWQFAASISLVAGSVCLMISGRIPPFMMGSGLLVAGGYVLLGLSATGEGFRAIASGVLLPVIQGLLIFRAGTQAAGFAAFQAKGLLATPFRLVDRFPLLVAGAMNMPGTALIALGGFQNGDLVLGLCASMWFIASLAMGLSDPALRRPDRLSI